jgi:hypothetical protein
MQRRRREEARRAVIRKEAPSADLIRLPVYKSVETPFIPPTICFTWSQHVKDSKHKHGFWGLGDTLRGMIATYQFCKQNRCNFLYDIHLHPFSHFLNYMKSPVHDTVETLLPSFYGVGGDSIRKPANGTISYIYGNPMCTEPLLDDEKKLIIDLLNIKEEYKLDLPKKYNVIHMRFGDSVSVENKKIDYTKYIRVLKYIALPGDILCCDSSDFKNIIAIEIPDIIVFNKECKSSHFGVDTDLDILKNTLDDLQVLMGANKIYTYSTYDWISNFVYWIARCNNIPVLSIDVDSIMKRCLTLDTVEYKSCHLEVDVSACIIRQIKSLPDKIIWTTMINSGYIEFTKNFMESYKRAGCTFTLVLFCLDVTSYNAFDSNANCIPILVNSTLSTELTSWASFEYKRIVFSKLDVMHYMLRIMSNDRDVSIGYIDTDIILFKDPTALFLSEMDTSPDISIFCQCDENSKECRNLLKCHSICTGVIVFRSNTPLELFDYTPHMIEKFETDQHYLQYVCSNKNIMIKTIPKNILLNGTWSTVTSFKPAIIPDTAVLLHFNYLVGSDKKRAMISQDMWWL